MHHLFLDTFIILIHLILIIRQLNKQQRIDMNTYLAISLSQLFPFLQGKAHQMLVQRAIRIRKVQGWIQYHALFNHTFSNNSLSRYLHIQIAFCLRGCRDTELNFWIDVLQHLLCLVGEFAGKHVLFVDDNDDRNILFFLGSASKIIERSTLLRITYHHGIIPTDTLPVNEKDFSRMDVAFGRMVKVVINDRMQLLSFRKEGFHLKVALLMKFVGSNPNICQLFIRYIRTVSQLCIQPEQHF